jgi:hypothetical protein
MIIRNYAVLSLHEGTHAECHWCDSYFAVERLNVIGVIVILLLKG